MKKFKLLFILLLSTKLFAYSPNFTWLGSSDVFKLEPVKDSILLGTGFTLNMTDLLLNNIHQVNTQEFFQTVDKSQINSLDRYFMQDYSKPLDITGDVFVALAFSSPFLFFATNKDYIPTIFVMYAETLLLAKGTTGLLKGAIHRSRPCMYYENYPKDFEITGDWNNSWPSGHTTYAFATASFMTYTFSKLNPDSKLKYMVAAGAYSIALTTGILRIASGNHFPTDVITGATFGTLWGILVPMLHLNKSSPITLTPNGVNFEFKF